VVRYKEQVEKINEERGKEQVKNQQNIDRIIT
jgi:hypothetical protein